MYGDIEQAKYNGFDDADWYHVGIPHSFGIPYFMENHFYVGYGCYRKKLEIKKEWINKKLYLEFQGSFQETEVFVNGQLASTHKGGYTAFVVDISPYIHLGENLIFVRVNNNWNPRLAPRAGEHVFQGGIYRDVSLIVVEPLHISWYGTFVTTPEISKERAQVEILTELENDFDFATSVTLESIIEFEGNIISKTSYDFPIDAGKSHSFSHKQEVISPHLWHPDNPVLYLLRSKIYMNRTLVDEYETEFGMRWFSFTADKGFFLNGEHYDILGANVHQDQAGWGDAVTHTSIARDIRLIKDCGMNFIRGSHYPHHSVFASECDKQGILFWSELCFWGIGGFKEDGYWNSSAYPTNPDDIAEFEESCIATLKEMIRINRNHPSIIVWSMSNEVFFSAPEVLDCAKNLIKKLVEVSHECDTSRPAASGGAQRGGFDVLGDIAGYNGDGASLYINPGFPSFVSEYGSTIADRPGEFIPSYTDGVEQNYSWRSGKAIWCGFHHGSIADNMGHMGMIDYYRLPLLSWYWYRQNQLGIAPPVLVSEGIADSLQLTCDKSHILTDGTDDTQIIITVVDKNKNPINNSFPVTLQITNGGALFPTGKTITLSPDQKNLVNGLGAITLRAFYAGEITVIAFSDQFVSNELTITAVGSAPWENQKLNLQKKPPCVLIPKFKDKITNQAKNRPVFSSGFATGFSPQNINDGNNSTSWRAENNEMPSWIMQDLEGCKNVSKIDIFFGDIKNTHVIISSSTDGNHFETIAKEAIVEPDYHFSKQLDSTTLRYLKVEFLHGLAEIKELELY